MALLREFSKFLVTERHTHGTDHSTPAQARGIYNAQCDTISYIGATCNGDKVAPCMLGFSKKVRPLVLHSTFPKVLFMRQMYTQCEEQIA